MSDEIQYLVAAIPFGWCSKDSNDHEHCPVETKTIWFGKIWKCPCHCHPEKTADQMMADMARQLGITLPSAGEYALTPPPPPSVAPLLAPTANDMAAITETGALPLFPPDIDVEFSPTRTGRLARGELEYRVKQCCDRYVAGAISDSHGGLTPATIADFIDPEDPPSVGAIGAVFDRWTELKIARIERSPLRFIGYTEEARRHGLQFLKNRAKQLKKTQHAGWAQPGRK